MAIRMIVDVGMISKVGLVRNINQDASFVNSDGENGFFVVSDGMGGYSHGEVASSMIISELSAWWYDILPSLAEYEISELAVQCRRVLEKINRDIYKLFSEQNTYGGATVCVLIIREQKYAILYAGDSRIYKRQDRKMTALTRDDVWENLPEVSGVYSKTQINLDSRRGKLTSAMGAAESIHIKIKLFDMDREELFFLCSDGIYKYMPDEKLHRIMCPLFMTDKADQMLKKIEKVVLEQGANDDYTAVVCRAISTGKKG